MYFYSEGSGEDKIVFLFAVNIAFLHKFFKPSEVAWDEQKHYSLKVWGQVRFFYVFERNLLSLRLLNKNTQNSNTVKYYCNLKFNIFYFNIL